METIGPNAMIYLKGQKKSLGFTESKRVGADKCRFRVYVSLL